MTRWLEIAERSLHTAFFVLSLVTTTYWVLQNFSGPLESGTQKITAEAPETAPQSAAEKYSQMRVAPGGV